MCTGDHPLYECQRGVALEALPASVGRLEEESVLKDSRVEPPPVGLEPEKPRLGVSRGRLEDRDVAGRA
eukprot:6239527-Lingulodinium_polyedra.AAC.1